MEEREYLKQYEMEDRHWWYLGHRRLYASLLDRFCPRAPGGRVLDAGCGTGGFTRWMRERYRPRYLAGVDISERALRLCRKRGLEELRCCGVENLPFADESFDLVLSLNVIYHRAVCDDEAALREMARVLALGGWLLLNLPALPILRGRHDHAVEGVRRYLAGQVREMLAAAGLTPVKETYFVFTPLPAVAVFRLASRLSPRPRSSSDLWMPPAPLNRSLTALLGLESCVATRWRLPLGSSLTALARKSL
jgi:SAM-dependent methyltransferase